MPPQDWTRLISASVIPIAIISANALLCLALYNRLASMVSRLRGFQRERLAEYEEYAEHVRSGCDNPAARDHHQRVLEMLEVQTRRVYRRARMMRSAIILLLMSVAALTLCSLVMGLAFLLPGIDGAARRIVECLFLGGMVLMFLGVVQAIAELWNSLEPVQLESQFVSKLARQLDAEVFKDEPAMPADGCGDTTEKD